MKSKYVSCLFAVVLVVALAGVAFAFTSPTSNAEVGYDLWDLIVNKFIKGPIGTTTGVVFMAIGAIAAALGRMSAAAWPLVGGGVLVAAPTLATSLGMIF